VELTVLETLVGWVGALPFAATLKAAPSGLEPLGMHPRRPAQHWQRLGLSRRGCHRQKSPNSIGYDPGYNRGHPWVQVLIMPGIPSSSLMSRFLVKVALGCILLVTVVVALLGRIAA
jgi:hypothetical protein